MIGELIHEAGFSRVAVNIVNGPALKRSFANEILLTQCLNVGSLWFNSLRFQGQNAVQRSEGLELLDRVERAGQGVRKRPRYAPGLSPTRSLNNLQKELASL
ncbi:hypothetical protein GCM10011400_07920 [Paraburkholderia caffeinilytica]|uniref:Uncharacterized protein n=1 Tax=Paraburkholderia caffeinilytica TaxID=1761016 RepID=A0ABQ1LGT9_9BURK|nr:hypothetical protein GCM10011400_07920 [Paraburkholderia caffeinilytica]CAB3776709.1 hypothetical protein LMG28690_00266 [Paraburkholderia caffeinilytica]